MDECKLPEAFVIDRLNEVLSITGEDITERIGNGHISPTAYDTGWVARISDLEGEPEFPKTLDWLRANQRDDGSWGAEVFHEYDRFINTLSASIALKERDIGPEKVAQAEVYLTAAMDRLKSSQEGVASDHLVAMLLEEARLVGLDLPYHDSPHRMASPLKRIMQSYRYINEEHPLGFFAEILGRLPNQNRITKRLQKANGSISSSAATTSASIVFDPSTVLDHRYYDKLRFISETIQPDGGVRHFWDLETMERVYGLYNLMHSQMDEEAFMRSALKLRAHWDHGLSFGTNFQVQDLDNSAMGYSILTKVGHEPDPSLFDLFWRDRFFVTYKVQERGQPGPNIHALEALALSSHPEKDALIDGTLRFLRSKMIDGDHFVDEWHMSPAYPTAHAIFAFHLTEEALMERCVSFFLDTQLQDGSWGFIENGNGLGTLEETAFALQGLLYYNQNVERIDMAPIRQGVEYTLAHLPAAKYPEMWMAKVLNAPEIIIESLIIGALLMYKKSNGGGVVDVS